MSLEDLDPYRVAAATALADVDHLKPAESDRTVILAALLRARLDNVESMPTLGTERVSELRGGEPPASGEDAVLTRLGKALGLDREVIEQVYSVVEHEPVLVVPPSKLPRDKASATRTICHLVAAARQLADVEDWSSAKTLRAVVTEFGAFDQSNFASHMRSLDDIAVFRGQGRGREMRITRPGIEATTVLIKALVATNVGDGVR